LLARRHGYWRGAMAIGAAPWLLARRHGYWRGAMAIGAAPWLLARAGWREYFAYLGIRE